MSIEIPESTGKEKRIAALARAREAKREKAEAAKAAPTRPTGPRLLTEEEVAALDETGLREYRRVLLDGLADTPNPDADKPGLTPGTLVGDGPVKDKVAYTPEWYQANFALKEVIAPEDMIIRVNGVGFSLFKDRKCFLPEPHYAVYTDRLARLRELERRYAPPENPSRNAGYISPVHQMGTGFFHTPEQADAQKS